MKYCAVHLDKQKYKNIRLRFREGSSHTCTSGVGEEERTCYLLGFYSSASICKVVKRVGGEEEALFKGIAKSGAGVINN